MPVLFLFLVLVLVSAFVCLLPALSLRPRTPTTTVATIAVPTDDTTR
jgi:hypothetical protein